MLRSLDEHVEPWSPAGLKGIPLLQWGSHLGHFFGSGEELRDVLVPYRFTPHPGKCLVDVWRRQRGVAAAASRPASQRASESDERRRPDAH